MKLNKLIMMMFIAFSITLTGCQSNEDEQHYDKSLEKTNKKGQMSS